jgi:hypothetical protein
MVKAAKIDWLAKYPALARLHPRPPLTLALSAALLPLAGVLAFDWPVASVIGLYWIENVLVGLFWLPRMLGSQTLLPDPKLAATLEASDATRERAAELLHNSARVQHWILPGFFVVHYGLFCAAHLAFITFVFDGAFAGWATALGLVTLAVMVAEEAWKLRAFRSDPGLAALPRAPLMMAPYPRIIALQFALIVGMLPAIAGWPVVAAVLLAVIRFAVDYRGLFGVVSVLRRPS